MSLYALNDVLPIHINRELSKACFLSRAVDFFPPSVGRPDTPGQCCRYAGQIRVQKRTSNVWAEKRDLGAHFDTLPWVLILGFASALEKFCRVEIIQP